MFQIPSLSLLLIKKLILKQLFIKKLWKHGIKV